MADAGHALGVRDGPQFSQHARAVVLEHGEVPIAVGHHVHGGQILVVVVKAVFAVANLHASAIPAGEEPRIGRVHPIRRRVLVILQARIVGRGGRSRDAGQAGVFDLRVLGKLLEQRLYVHVLGQAHAYEQVHAGEPPLQTPAGLQLHLAQASGLGAKTAADLGTFD